MKVLVPGNYCAHALPDMQRYLAACRKVGREDDVAVIEGLIAGITDRGTPKFVIDSTALYAEFSAALNSGYVVEELNLPFDSIIIEAQHPLFPDEMLRDMQGTGYNGVAYDRMIILVCRMEGSVFVTSIARCYVQGRVEWVPNSTGARLIVAEGSKLPVGAMVREPFEGDRTVPGVALSLVELFDPESLVGITPGSDTWFKLRLSDICVEAYTVVQFLWALEQRRTDVTFTPASAKLNKARAKRGALPFDDYRVVTVSPQTEHVPSGITHPDRLSPREHQRREHWRHFPNGNRVRVRATVVNPGIGGAVWHDYRIDKKDNA